MAEDTANSIEIALQPLIGLPLSLASEFLDMRIFYFGSIRPSRNGKKLVGSHALHIQCSWRLTGPDGIITGYSDRFSALDPDGEPDRENVRSGDLQKIRIEEFLGGYDEQIGMSVDRTGRHIVTTIEADQYGSVDIVFNNDLRLEIFADNSFAEDWRFLSTDLNRPPHFVVAGGKVATKR